MVKFFTTKPVPCDPSSLPRYPPSKEFDAKMREEEARRQGAVGKKGPRVSMERSKTRESRAVPAPDANAELISSLQKRQAQVSSKSRSEKFNPQQEEIATGFPIEPPRPSKPLVGERPNLNPEGARRHPKRASHSGPLVPQSSRSKAGGSKNLDDVPKLSAGEDSSSPALSTMLSLSKSQSSSHQKDKLVRLESSAHKMITRFPGSLKETSVPLESKQGSLLSSSSHDDGDGRTGKSDPVLIGYGSKGGKIHYSGPLLVPSRNTDQIMKDHDRHIQEAARRARFDKIRLKKMQQVEGCQSAAATSLSGR